MRVASRIEPELGVEHVARGITVIAIAIGMEMAVGDDEIDALRLAADLSYGVPGAVASSDDLRLHLRRLRPVFCEHRYHAARGVAVQRGERPPQHFDPLRRGEAEAASLT